MADGHKRAQIPQNHAHGGATEMSRFDSSEVEGSRTAAHILTNCKLVDIGKVTRSNVLQYLGRLKWNHRRTVLETAELFWQTGHRSTWPGLCAQCSWNLITWREGDHGSGWCNHTDKAGPWCVIVAVMLILCIYSNWNPRENIPNVCVCVFGCLCGCMRVRDTWRELGVALLRQVDHPGWPVLTGWYVSFFRGLLRGPHCSHACMTHGAVSVCLSVSLAKCSVLYNCFMVLPSKEQHFTLSGYATPLFIAILQ